MRLEWKNVVLIVFVTPRMTWHLLPGMRTRENDNAAFVLASSLYFRSIVLSYCIDVFVVCLLYVDSHVYGHVFGNNF